MGNTWEIIIFLSLVSSLLFTFRTVIGTLTVICTSPLLYFAVLYVFHLNDLKKYPPGPFPLPVIGNFNLIYGSALHDVYTELGEQWGDVFSISLGMERTVIVNSIEAVNEVLVTKGNVFLGRPNSYTDAIFTRGGKTVGFADYGPYWVMGRKLGMHFFHQFAKGNKLEDIAVWESDKMLERLQRKEGKPINVKHDMGLVVMNVLFQITFGYTYEENDEEHQHILQLVQDLVTTTNTTDVFAAVPFLSVFPNKYINKLKAACKGRDILLNRITTKHLESFDPDNPRDMLDCFLNARDDTEILKKFSLPELTNSDCEMLIHDLVFAGMQSTLSQMRWAVLYLLHYPEYQELMYKEIIDVCGPDEYPATRDRNNLHMVTAVSQEALRAGVASNVGLIHQALQDDSVGGFPVPKGTPVVTNIWSCHYDKREWDEPKLFNPSRWLDENGKYDGSKSRSFLPFSLGRRNCSHEGAARTIMYIMLTRLIKDFRFEYDPAEGVPSLVPTTGYILFPYPFNIILHRR